MTEAAHLAKIVELPRVLTPCMFLNQAEEPGLIPPSVCQTLGLGLDHLSNQSLPQRHPGCPLAQVIDGPNICQYQGREEILKAFQIKKAERARMRIVFPIQ